MSEKSSLGVFVGKRYTTFTNLLKTSYFHVFFEKCYLSFSVCKKISYFREKEMSSFLKIKKDYIPVHFFWKDHLFGTFEEYIMFPCVFFWERSSFIYRLKNSNIFFGKRNIIFPDDTRKIILQCNFFGKIIFSEHLEKEDNVFRAVWCWKMVWHIQLWWKW